MPTKPTKLGSKLKRLRKAHGFTRDVVAAKCGVTRQTIWNLETGRTTPSAHYLQALAKTLGIEPAELLA